MIFNNFVNIYGKSPFSKMSSEDETYLREIEYIWTTLSNLCSQYDIKGFATPSYRIMLYKLVNGTCGAFRWEDGKVHVGYGSYYGNIDEDTGLGKQYICTLANGKQYRGVIGKDVEILKNNSLGVSSYYRILRYISMLSNIDMSMLYNIIYTRVCPIPIVETDSERNSMQQVLDNLFSNKMKIFKRSMGKDVFNTGVQKADKLDLTQPQASQYLQNLSRFWEEWLTRLYMEHGIIISTKDKGAQLSEKELDAFKSYAEMPATDQYNELIDFVERCRNTFGIDCTVTKRNYVSTDILKNEDVSRGTLEEGENENDDDSTTSSEIN